MSRISTVFCDDIRHEIGGKLSLIGCYGETVSLPQLPASIPKLCVFFVLNLEDLEGKIQIELRLTKNQEVLLNQTATFEQMPNTESEHDSQMVQGALSLPTQTIDKGDVFDLIAIIEGVEHRHRKLVVDITPEHTP